MEREKGGGGEKGGRSKEEKGEGMKNVETQVKVKTEEGEKGGMAKKEEREKKEIGKRTKK